MLARADRALARIERAGALVSGVVIFALMILGIVQVLGRKFFNAPVFGYIDIVELSMIVFALLPIAFCERLGGHVRMEILTRRLVGRVRWIAEFGATAIALFAVTVIGWYGLAHALRAFEYGDTTIDAEIITWPAKIVVPLALGLLSLRLVVQLAGYARLIAHPGATPIAVPQDVDAGKEALTAASAEPAP